MRNCERPRLDYPDQMVFDLDPAGNNFEAVKAAARNFADQGATETPGISTVTKNRVRDGVPTLCQNPDVILRVISLGLLTDSAFASLTALERNVSAEWLFFRAALARDMPEHCSPDEHVLRKRREPRSNFFPAGSAESGGVGMAALSGALNRAFSPCCVYDVLPGALPGRCPRLV